MSIRRRFLPQGWYPGSAAACRQEIEEMRGRIRDPQPVPAGLFGGVVPHAGWYFSGAVAAKVAELVARGGAPDVIAVIGGHLGGYGAGLVYLEEGWETPLGDIAMDVDLARALEKKMGLEVERDSTGDNTVEVQLPLIKYFFPESRMVALRGPHSQAAVALGRELVGLAQAQGKSLKVIGSTDLTHYGPNYGFMPQGEGQKAVDWVRNVNDKGFIDLALGMDVSGLLQHAARYHSACSAGAAAAAIAACQVLGSRQGVLVAYYTSNEAMAGDSFVGYAGIVY
jgi:hypothetical protein